MAFVSWKWKIRIKQQMSAFQLIKSKHFIVLQKIFFSLRNDSKNRFFARLQFASVHNESMHISHYQCDWTSGVQHFFSSFKWLSNKIMNKTSKNKIEFVEKLQRLWFCSTNNYQKWSKIWLPKKIIIKNWWNPFSSALCLLESDSRIARQLCSRKERINPCVGCDKQAKFHRFIQKS